MKITITRTHIDSMSNEHWLAEGEGLISARAHTREIAFYDLVMANKESFNVDDIVIQNRVFDGSE